MAKYEKVVHGDFQEIVEQLNAGILKGGRTMHLVAESSYEAGAHTTVVVRVYDKYFIRIRNRASLSVVFVNSEDEIFLTAIAAGGGSFIPDSDMDVELELLELVAEILTGMGL